MCDADVVKVPEHNVVLSLNYSHSLCQMTRPGGGGIQYRLCDILKQASS